MATQFRTASCVWIALAENTFVLDVRPEQNVQRVAVLDTNVLLDIFPVMTSRKRIWRLARRQSLSRKRDIAALAFETRSSSPSI
jgi:hypothetical protein